MCSISCDERQRLRRPVFFDSASTHGHSPLFEIYTGQGFDALASGGYLSPQQEVAMDRPVFQPLAEIEIDAVTPSNHGFTLTGQGAGPDRAEYRVDLHFELPLDSRTRTVLGELLSQADITISRRTSEAPETLRPPLRSLRSRSARNS